MWLIFCKALNIIFNEFVIFYKGFFVLYSFIVEY